VTDRTGTIVIPGGAGYLGRVLADHFAKQSRPVVILSRQPHAGDDRTRYLVWDGETPGDWVEAFEGAEAVVNLAGRSVNCRYNARNRQEIYDSRLRSTKVIGEAIARCSQPPQVWINSSSATIYRHTLDRPMDEATGEIGTGFSVDVCLKWEQTLADAATSQTRKVALRSAIVFGKGHGGAMEAFLRLVRLGLGGTLGPGTQYVSWIHAEDYARSVQWIMAHPELDGPVNCASPNPAPNAVFMRTLREVCRQPIGLPVAAWMLEIGAFCLQTETELLLKSRRVVPGRLLASGFRFQYPELHRALEAIVNGGSETAAAR
jgi:uncharacterized protein (TIGR01777 family)